MENRERKIVDSVESLEAARLRVREAEKAFARFTQEQVEGVRRIVGQFVSQMNAQLSGQMTTLGHTMEMVSQGQLQTQKNLQNTLSAQMPRNSSDNGFRYIKPCFTNLCFHKAYNINR